MARAVRSFSVRAFPAFLLALFSALALSQDSPRLRTTLPNHAVVFAENIPGAKLASVQLFFSSRGTSESPTTHGFRHLLEHLMLKGTKKDLDARLEEKGIYFVGRTLRDFMEIEFTCKPEQIPEAIAAAGELLQPINVTQADIDHEVLVMKQELAIQSDANRFSRSAWGTAYGEEGLEPFGDLAVMANATPDNLQAIQTAMTKPSNVVLAIAGPLNIDAVTKIGKKLLGTLEAGGDGEDSARKEGTAGRVELDDAFGEGRAAIVEGVRTTSTMHTLAAALALASEFDDAFVTYTPSVQNGLILVGHTDESSGIGLKLDAMTDSEIAALYPRGKMLARRWVLGQLSSPAGDAYLRGSLLSLGSTMRPEDMIEAIDNMKWQDFVAAMHRFDKLKSVVFVGVRP